LPFFADKERDEKVITRCNNGHWYDSAVNKSCPHCKNASEKLSIRLDDVEEDDHTISIAEADISLGEELGAIIGSSMGNNNIPDSGEDADDDRTISFGFFDVTSTQPVVGWLVCMKGNEKGKDFRLHSGKNFIGRSVSMDIVLVDDKKISREKHCSVTYDPKGNHFFLSPEGGNLTYKNDELLESPVELNEGEQITIGETELLFIPFCKEERKWEKESEKESV
jgi:hypothetical protein